MPFSVNRAAPAVNGIQKVGMSSDCTMEVYRRKEPRNARQHAIEELHNLAVKQLTVPAGLVNSCCYCSITMLTL